MIKVKLIMDDKSFDLFMEGHADFSEKGTDIVCAGVSILIQNLADCLDDMSSYYDVDRNDEGMITHIGAAGKNAAILCEFVVHGLRLIANAYPDNLSLSY